ncbi:MAG: hypothetical protein WD424_09280, partial [Paenibacillaceae bacterium]
FFTAKINQRTPLSLVSNLMSWATRSHWAESIPDQVSIYAPAWGATLNQRTNVTFTWRQEYHY